MNMLKKKEFFTSLTGILALMLAISVRAGELERTDKIQANFIMVRKISVLKESVESSGVLVLGGAGLLRWETLKPSKSVLIVNKGNGWIHYPDLDVLKSFDVSSDPVMKTLSEHLLSITRRDFDAISHWYTIKEVDSGEYKLFPKLAQVKRIFRELNVRISKKGLISKVVLISAQGDSTEISFSKIKVNPEIPRGVFQRPKVEHQ